MHPQGEVPTTRVSEGAAEAALGLARALSLEDLLARLCRACVEHLPCAGGAVYLPRGGALVRAACEPAAAPFAATLEVGASELRALDAGPRRVVGPPWSQRLGVARLAATLPGRRRAAGFVLLDEVQDGEGAGAALRLLLGLTGALLEHYVVEERRTRSLELQRPALALAKLGLIGESPAMRQVAELVARLARVESSVLLTGETGTGKTLVAEAIHRASARRERPFLALNCGAIPEALVESELFGHEAGAFTGAQRLHRGKVEQARGGTLFLDEVVELPAAAQAKLLGFLESRRFTRVGGEQELEADVRVISATNAAPEQALAAGRLREDLYYRLNVFTLELPPLRERGRDVLLLARSFADEVARRYAYPPPELGLRAESRLLAYPWPGNVRELRNVLEKAVVLSEGGALAEELFPDGAGAGSGSAAGPPAPAAAGLDFAEAKARALETWEQGYLRELLARTGGNVARACRESGIDKRNLQRKVKRYGIDLEAIRRGEGSG
ncbi:MAG: sigma-54 interaction domain-containing protein [Planctomycetota bacterium]